jgi:hypothetical protein
LRDQGHGQNAVDLEGLDTAVMKPLATADTLPANPANVAPNVAADERATGRATGVVSQSASGGSDGTTRRRLSHDRTDRPRNRVQRRHNQVRFSPDARDADRERRQPRPIQFGGDDGYRQQQDAGPSTSACAPLPQAMQSEQPPTGRTTGVARKHPSAEQPPIRSHAATFWIA